MKTFCLTILLLSSVLAQAQRAEFVLEKGWKFSKGNFENAAQVNFDDSKWESVSVPHDWAIYGPFDKEVDKQVVAITQNNEKEATEKTGRTGALPYIGDGWYRTNFSFRITSYNVCYTKFLRIFSESEKMSTI